MHQQLATLVVFHIKLGFRHCIKTLLYMVAYVRSISHEGLTVFGEICRCTTKCAAVLAGCEAFRMIMSRPATSKLPSVYTLTCTPNVQLCNRPLIPVYATPMGNQTAPDMLEKDASAYRRIW